MTTLTLAFLPLCLVEVAAADLRYYGACWCLASVDEDGFGFTVHGTHPFNYDVWERMLP